MRLLPACLSLLALSCASAPEREGLVHEIAEAHGEQSLYAMPALTTDVTVRFLGRPFLDARMTYEAASGRVRLDYADGGVAVFDGQDAWVSGLSGEAVGMARFHLLTWPYFLAAPWKLDDPGAHATPASTAALRGEVKATTRVTFEPGVGDTPDDWYVVYADPASKELDALAYVVTFGTSLEEAAAEPHVATYEEWTTVDGLRLPTRLAFWNWDEQEGLWGASIGTAVFAHQRFAPAPAHTFTPPPDAQRVDLPAGG